MSWKKIEITTLSFLIFLMIYKTSIFLRIMEITVFVLMFNGLYQKNTNAVCKSKKSLVGKTTIVTGGTRGMGLEIAVDFAHRGAKVIVACPFEEEGFRAKETIEKKTGSEKVIFKLLDLASFKSVRQFAEDINKTEDRLDILINNAGIAIRGHHLTIDGLNCLMQVNYFGPFLLTILLLPILQKTGRPSEPSRIVNTSSVQHSWGTLDLENWNRTDYWSTIRLYSNSKLCIVTFTLALSKKLKDTNIVVHAVDPGFVGTPLFNTVGVGSMWTSLIGVLFKKPWEGSQTALYVSLSNTVAKSSGKYYKNLKVVSPAAAACDEKVSKRVLDKSVELVKLTPDELRACNL